MQTFRRLLTSALLALASLAARLRFMPVAQRRTAIGGGVSALCLVALGGTLLVAGGHNRPPATSGHSGPTAATATATGDMSLTRRAKPSPTPTRVPQVKTVVQKPLPPPPPVPTPPPPPPTPTPCPTPTASPTATTAATATATPTATTAVPARNAQVTASLAGCTPCGVNAGNNPSRSAILAALNTAADTYHLPHNLVYAVAWQESKWHQDVEACDGGVGLMQIQYYLADYFNGLPYQSCGLTATTYDIHTLGGNALLGAKVLRFLYCYYTYGASYGGLPGSPAPGSSQRYYWDAGLNYPDLTKRDGTANPNGLCAQIFSGAANPIYTGLPSANTDPWSCPYSAQTTNDSTLLDIVVSAYNAGQGAIFNCSCIPNPGYVASVESFVPQFATRTLPPAA